MERRIMSITRKDFLRNLKWTAAGAMVGAPIGALGLNRLNSTRENWETESFSQSGEDVFVNFILGYLHMAANMTYLDVGAFHPTKLSNTYYFYRGGRRGVLVEPNVDMTELLRTVRPKDVTLVAGIGITDQREADYYVMTDPARNTFSKEEAEHTERVTNRSTTIREVRKIPLLNINDVMQERFGRGPTFLSVDTEGLDLAILKSIDYQRYRPTVICAETLVSGTRKTVAEIPEFMATQGYTVRGQTFVNTIFVDSRFL
jgi:FkbM family methyltransferase